MNAWIFFISNQASFTCFNSQYRMSILFSINRNCQMFPKILVLNKNWKNKSKHSTLVCQIGDCPVFFDLPNHLLHVVVSCISCDYLCSSFSDIKGKLTKMDNTPLKIPIVSIVNKLACNNGVSEFQVQGFHLRLDCAFRKRHPKVRCFR